MKPKEPRNLYELKPRRLVEWELAQDSRVTLLIPKFRKGLLARTLQPRLRRPLFRINLDEFGSFVWLSCNGKADVRSIGEEMMSKFGPSAEPVYDRIGQFLRQLESSKFIDFPESSNKPHKNLP
ncbi:MAG: PqqD family protein [Terriglobia bacterium]